MFSVADVTSDAVSSHFPMTNGKSNKG